MTHVRIATLGLLALTPAVWGQSVVSTHSGVVYFFAGSVFIGGDRLEQKFGKFPDIGEGRELKTEQGRAEVLLTPGVFLRIGENSSIRLLSSKLSDTRVELLTGSAVLEAKEPAAGTSVTLVHKNWQMRVPHEAAYRIDAAPPQVRVYQGQVEVATEGQKDVVRVHEGETLPLAAVLLTERTAGAETDSLKAWAMSRSQAITADNATAAGIIDDPSQFDSAGMAVGGYTYFPSGGISSLGIANPYGVSFWSPYQSILSSIYFPPYLTYGYGSLRPGWIGGGGSSWSSGVHPGGVRSLPRPIYPNPIVTPWRTGGGVRPGGISPPRPSYTSPSRPMPHVPPPPAAVHSPAHR